MSEEARDRGTLICRRLATDVAKLTPPGIGRWRRTWEIVSHADSEFLAALSTWEAAPSRAAAARVREAYAAVLDAWRSAVAAFERREAER